MLDWITPVVLTYNEECNIGRNLEKLWWAKDIVVVDSYSQDETVSIVLSCPRARLFQRSFDNHANQWNFAINKTLIKTDWILALDADYILTDEMVEELKRLEWSGDTEGYSASFLYKIRGRLLRSSLYPPVTVLYRRESAFYEQDGHTQRLVLRGKKKALRRSIVHDDQKPYERWVLAQEGYANLEAEKLIKKKWSDLKPNEKARRLGLAPILIAFYCLFLKKLVFEGMAGLVYTQQRVYAEIILFKHLIKKRPYDKRTP